ncbi:MAG: YraN family protein, partial [Blastocatellia bacterium]
MRSILQNWLKGRRDSEPVATHLSLGRRGEEMAIEHLKSLGYRIVTTNFMTPIDYSRKGRQISAEIDVIAYDESARPFTLCFVEVKTRSSAEIAAPATAVD